jgi:hypothetical protein
MSRSQIKAIPYDRQVHSAWVEGYDGQTHYGDVFKALTPAFFILAAATALMLAIL